MSRKLVLFDVDGTLITRCRVHEESFSVAFRKVLGIELGEKDTGSAGQTDRKIVTELMRKKGLDEKTIRSGVGHVFAAMSKHVEGNIKKDNSFHEIPHVMELLVELEKRGDILGLVTGNVEKIARLKLQKLGLLDFFEVGAFGNTSEKRSDLAMKAIKGAERKFKTKIDKKDVFVIGDTPRDIESGKETGVRTIAMATGPFTLFELKKHNPDYAFADFSEKDKIVQAMHKD